MKPQTGRNESFTKVLRTLSETFSQPITIVETGCIRGTDSMHGDGWSTVNWEFYSKHTRSTVHVVDISEQNVEVSKTIVPPSQQVIYHVGDSVEFLENFDGKIDMLYLDSYDYCGDEENVRACHEHSLREAKAAIPKMSSPSFVLIDDVFGEQYDGKGKLSIPFLVENGFEVVHHLDNQVFLRK